MVKNIHISRLKIFESTDAVTQLLERPVCVREVVGSIPGRVISKTLTRPVARQGSSPDIAHFDSGKF